MGWNNLIVGSNELHSVAKAYINVVNAITYFVKPTAPTNIISNNTILTQYSIKQELKVFGKKVEAEVRKELKQFHDYRVVTYNIWYGNEFVIHSPQRRTFMMTKAGIFYNAMRHLLKNKDSHIIVNDSHYPIPQVQDKKEIYTTRDIKRADRAMRFQHITGQPINRILHAVDNRILQNFQYCKSMA